MTRLKGFRLFIYCCLYLAFAQNKISGVVTDANGQLARVEIFNKSTNQKMFTDANGALEINEKSQQALILYSLKRIYHC
jgi:Fe(3+) dicitrate transport protein